MTFIQEKTVHIQLEKGRATNPTWIGMLDQKLPDIVMYICVRVFVHVRIRPQE